MIAALPAGHPQTLPQSAAEGPVRVLHVLGSLDPGGVESWLLALLPELDPTRWRFDFCTLGPAPGRYAARARSLGATVLSCPLGSGFNRWAFALRLHRLLRLGGYGVVHSHVHHFSAVVLGAARAAGVGVRVGHSHNTSDGRSNTVRRALYRALARRLLGRIETRGLACSAPAAAALFGPDWESGARVSVLPYGIPAWQDPGADRDSLRGELGLDPSAPVVGHVGRFEPQKNHLFLLQMAAAARTLRPKLRWLLVGEGPLRAPLARQARQLGIDNRIVTCGLRDDVRRLMSGAMDAFVLPSLWEGLPVALLEAQAAGLRSVASTRVPREASVVPLAVEFAPLEAGPHYWARRVLASLDAPRIAPADAARSIEERGLTIGCSLARLLAAYQTGTPGGRHVSAPAPTRPGAAARQPAHPPAFALPPHGGAALRGRP